MNISKKFKKAKKKNKKICLYGAGRHSYEFLRFLKDNLIIPDAILVTSKERNPGEILGVPVLQADKYLEKYDTFVIITVAEFSRNSIIEYIESFKCYDYSCI